MEIKSKEFATMLKRIAVGGVNKECAIITSPHGSTCEAVDMTSAMMVHINSPITFGVDTTLGIADIETLTKYLNNSANETVDAVVMDNRLVFTNGNTTFKYLLGKPETIGTVPESYTEDGLSEIMGIKYSFVIDDKAKTQYTDMAKIVKPQFVTLTMNRKGRVILEGGTETSNKFDIVLGDVVEPVEDSVSVRVMGDFFTNILAVLSVDKPAQLRLEEGVVAIVQETDYWVLNHTQDI
ncbi:MAG: hypothetical protein IKW35_05565 [Paludibacteraceae bacterium]|nr:hypothetical protein [Paludibacteraceae bacterium]